MIISEFALQILSGTVQWTRHLITVAELLDGTFYTTPPKADAPAGKEGPSPVKGM